MKRFSILFPLATTLALSSACSSTGSNGVGKQNVKPQDSEQADSGAPDGRPKDDSEGDSVEPETSTLNDTVVASLGDAEKAVFRIEATGTFATPLSQESTLVSTGTGFVVDADGYAVTNAHVVSGATLLRLQFPGETEQHNAQVVALSECSDLALLKVDGLAEATHLQWAESSAMLGTSVFALGYPLGGELTLTEGIVSKESTDAQTDWASVDDVIEHTATINPGNSGGPLLSSDYQVLGVNYAGNDYAQYYAIGNSKAQQIIERLRQGSDIESIGLAGVAAGDGTVSGIWVYSVKAGSPADAAGIRPGDLLTHFGGIPLSPNAEGIVTLEDYCDILRSHSAEAAIDVRVIRWQTGTTWEGQVNGRNLKQVELEPTVPTAAPEPTPPDNPNPEQISETVTHVDDALRITVPTTWSDRQSSYGYRSDGEKGAVLLAAPDLDAFQEFAGPGVLVTVWRSTELAPEDFVAMDTTQDENCKVHTDIEVTEAEEGVEFAQRLHSNCAGNESVVVVELAVSVEGQYSAFIEFEALTDQDLEIFEQVLSTLLVNTDNLP